MILRPQKGSFLWADDYISRRYRPQVQAARKRGWLVIEHDNPTDAIRDIQEGIRYAFLLTDNSFDRGRTYEGGDIAKESKTVNPATPVFFYSNYPVHCLYADRVFDKEDLHFSDIRNVLSWIETMYGDCILPRG